ncbi:hypothetical protein BX600DRAFT_369857, partial [Xylariales sp. PMI_506]
LTAMLLGAHVVDAATFPATVEVDLIFPRNDTYAPTTLFPVVFAFQNAALVPSLDPGITLDLYNITDPNNTIATFASPVLDLTQTNFSISDPTYVYTYIAGLDALTDDSAVSYHLVWSTSAGNCSSQGGALTFGGGWVDAGIVFTIQKGAQQPDLVSAMASSTSSCNSTSHFAFNLTGTLDVTQTDKWDGHNTCAVFSDVQPQVAGNPCAVNVSDATASSISASITATACAAVSPVVSCPATKNMASARGVNMGDYSTAILSGVAVAAFIIMQ